jgi:hypothetical protein
MTKEIFLKLTGARASKKAPHLYCFLEFNQSFILLDKKMEYVLKTILDDL